MDLRLDLYIASMTRDMTCLQITDLSTRFMPVLTKTSGVIYKSFGANPSLESFQT